MLNKEILRLMAEAERMMDSGEMPFVMAPGPSGGIERMAMSPRMMEEYGLEQGQTINTIIRDAILQENVKTLRAKIESIMESTEDAFLDEEFDFRDYMNEGDNDA